MALMPILPAPELAANRSNPKVEAPTIALPMRLEFTFVLVEFCFGLANLRICQRHFPSKVRRLEKYPQEEKEVPPEVALPARGFHRTALDGKGGENLYNQVIGVLYRALWDGMKH
jgi:hypothetical protein